MLLHYTFTAITRVDFKLQNDGLQRVLRVGGDDDSTSTTFSVDLIKSRQAKSFDCETWLPDNVGFAEASRVSDSDCALKAILAMSACSSMSQHFWRAGEGKSVDFLNNVVAWFRLALIVCHFPRLYVQIVVRLHGNHIRRLYIAQICKVDFGNYFIVLKLSE